MRRLACALAAVLTLGSPVLAQPGASHSFDLTYRSFGPVSATSAFEGEGPVQVRFEGCYAKDGPEAICGFTLRARRRVTVSNIGNLSHGTRADGAPMRTCCLFRQGRPEGFPIIPAPAGEGVPDLAAVVEPGRDLAVMLRLPDYATGSPLRAISLSLGGSDPGRTFPATVRRLP